MALVSTVQSAFEIPLKTTLSPGPGTPSGSQFAGEVTAIMQNNTKNFVLVAMRSVAQGHVVDYAYQVKLSDPADNVTLIQQLENINGIRGITYTNQEATVQV